MDILFDSGKLEKMIIRAYKATANADERPELSDDEADKYMVQVNPETYSIHYQVNYDRLPGHGNSGSEAKYANSPPPSLQFDFIFDGTGVIPPPAGPLDNVPIAGAVAGAIDSLTGGDDDQDVDTQLKKFAAVVYDYSGDQHQPRKIQLTWGTLIFDGVLSSLTIDYKLFKPDGSPLRAIAKATFEGSINDTLRENKERNSSPDLTHVRSIRAGDKLPLMTHSIYRNAAYYLEVARANKLYNFRRLRTGDQISFPPLDKTAR